MMDLLPAGPVILARLHAGPLADHVGVLFARFAGQGYSRSTLKEQVRSIAILNQWLGRRSLGTGELDEKVIEQFLEEQHREGLVHRSMAWTVKAVLRHLRDLSIVPPPSQGGDSHPLLALEREYEEFLTRERGLAPATLDCYLPTIRKFLSERFGSGLPLLMELRASDISGFVLRHAHAGSPGTAKLMVTALRSFLRFLHVSGEIAVDLANSVPTVTDWRLSTLPKFISSDQVEHLLRSCDRSVSTGLRNCAILLLLARLGLRAGEIVAMELDDFDWEQGLLTVRGKGRRRDRLPIPADVGEAVTAYLCHGRPRCPTRRVFIRHRAPFRGFANSVAICTIVRRAIEAAGIQSTRKGAHVLRHSLATRMLRQGASLSEIGEILRHRLPSTSEIYAKVDISALSELAQPWPGEGV